MGFPSSLGNEIVSRQTLASLTITWDHKYCEIPRKEHRQLQFILSLHAAVRSEKQIILRVNSTAPVLVASLCLPPVNYV